MEISIALLIFLSVIAVVVVAAVIIWGVIQLSDYLRRLRTPNVIINIDCKHTWLCASSSCTVPISWIVDVSNGEIDTVSVELERIEEYSDQVLSQISLSGDISGELDLPTTDGSLFSESGRYRVKVTVVTAGSRDQEPTIRNRSHYFRFNSEDEFKYVDRLGGSIEGYEVVEDGLSAHRSIIISDPESSYSVGELRRKEPQYLRTCPKSMTLVAISYVEGYHISAGQETNGLSSLPILVRRPEENNSLEEIEVELGKRVDLTSEALVENGIEIYIKFSDQRNVSSPVRVTRAVLEYHFRAVR